MKRIFLLIVITLTIPAIVLSQSCLPEGIIINHQIQIDSFQTNYPNCTEIEGSVIFALGANIENLNGLNSLTRIGGSLAVSEYGPMSNFIGLENLTSIGGDLVLGNYIDAGSCTVSDFTGLENLNSIGGDLVVYDTWNLLNFSGLDNLTSVNGHILIGAPDGKNYGLVSLDGLENIETGSIWYIEIDFNPHLTTCSIKSICDYISNPNGTLHIGGYNAQGCKSINQVEAGCEAIGISDISLRNKFLIFPNPATLEINISTKNRRGIKEVNIYNIIGQNVLHRDDIGESIDLSALGQGIYIIELSSAELKIREKLIIER